MNKYKPERKYSCLYCMDTISTRTNHCFRCNKCFPTNYTHCINCNKCMIYSSLGNVVQCHKCKTIII